MVDYRKTIKELEAQNKLLSSENDKLKEENNRLEGRLKGCEEALKNIETTLVSKVEDQVQKRVDKAVQDVTKGLEEKFIALSESLKEQNSPSTETPSSSDFPPLSSSTSKPPSDTSFASIVARTPHNKKFTHEEFNIFHAPAPRFRKPPTLPPPDSSEDDLLNAVDRIYIDDVQPMAYSELKKLFSYRAIPVNHIISIDYIGLRERFGLPRTVLEITCYKSSSTSLQRDLIQRWGAKILKGYSAGEPSKVNAGEDIRKLVLENYRKRMLRHANRKEDNIPSRRRLFGIWYMRAGGNRDKLEKLESEPEMENGGTGRAEEEEVQAQLVGNNFN